MNRIVKNLKGILFAGLTLLSGATALQCGGLGGWGLGGLYDPTSIIQGASDYRQNVMDWSNYGWGQYMAGDDYLGYDDWVAAGEPL